MIKRVLTKPDGRALILFSAQPMGPTGPVPSLATEPHQPNAHLRNQCLQSTTPQLKQLPQANTLARTRRH